MLTIVLPIPNYLLPLVAEHARARDRLGNQFIHHQILHDNWCAQLNGRGGCNCNPEITTFTDAEWRRRKGH